MSDSKPPGFKLCEECSRIVSEIGPWRVPDKALKALQAMRALNVIVEDFTRDVRTLNDRYIERMRDILDSL